jgi:excisionase family DNA binding protein
MESMMTARQVAELLGVHENWVYDHAASGELPSYKIGGTRRFIRVEVDGFIAERRAPECKRPERRANASSRRRPGGRTTRSLGCSSSDGARRNVPAA